MENNEFCVLESEEDIIQYEKNLFNAFSSNDPDGWVMNNYELIDGCRLRSKNLKYLEDIECYAFKKDGKIKMGASVNFNTNKKLQLEEMGFNIDKNDGPYCEGLILYTDNSNDFDFIKASTNLFEFVKLRLIEKNIKVVYGTCSRKFKAMYSLLGYNVIDRLEYNGQKKLLMKMKL